MHKERVRQSIDYARQALDALRDTVGWVEACTESPERGRRVDAVAKRFEVSFEYLWKALQSAARYKGDEVLSPRDAIQSAHKLKWLTDVEEWAHFLEARKCGMQDYFGFGSEEYFAVAKDFLTAAVVVIRRLEKVV